MTLIDSVLSHGEFVLMNNVIKNLKIKRIVHQRF